MRKGVLVSALAAAAMFCGVATASALPNGGFEQGTLSGWGYRTLGCPFFTSGSANSSGAAQPSQWLVHGAGTSLDESFGLVNLPDPDGNYAATFIQNFASWGVLHRSFRVPRKARSLDLNIFWINQASGGAGGAGAPTRGSLPSNLWAAPTTATVGCPSEPSTQYAKVDLLRAGASPRSLKKADTLATIWRSVPGRTSGVSGGWIDRNVSLKRFRGKRVRLRIAVIDTIGYLNLGVDRVRIRR